MSGAIWPTKIADSTEFEGPREVVYDSPMPADLEGAWDALHTVVPSGWYVGRPSYHDERREWLLYAFDPSERAIVGVRKREWTAVALTEEGVVGEMARCLAEIGAGRVPK